MSLSTDWLLLFLRLLFVVVLFFFLYQIVRLTTRELMLLAERDQADPPVRRPSSRLVVLDAAESSVPEGTTLPLSPYSTVGRHPGCTIVLDDSFVSSEHASLELAGNRWYVRDLGSTNGTFVNGHAVETSAGLDDGDVVQFGRVKVEFLC
jgi:hypothetical protein